MEHTRKIHVECKDMHAPCKISHGQVKNKMWHMQGKVMTHVRIAMGMQIKSWSWIFQGVMEIDSSLRGTVKIWLAQRVFQSAKNPHKVCFLGKLSKWLGFSPKFVDLDRSKFMIVIHYFVKLPVSCPQFSNSSPNAAKRRKYFKVFTMKKRD